MATDVKTVCEIEQVGRVVDLLQSTTHHGFPVVADGPVCGRVLGVVLRPQVCMHTSCHTSCYSCLHRCSHFCSHLCSHLCAQLVAILAKRDFGELHELRGHARGAPLSADDFARPVT